MCHWPVGDPMEDGFHFCGRRKSSGTPYANITRPSRTTLQQNAGVPPRVRPEKCEAVFR